MGWLAHSQLSPYLKKLDTLKMSKPRSKHLAGKPLAAPAHTAPGQSSPREPSSIKPYRLRLKDQPPHPRSLPGLRHQLTSTERGWRDAAIQHMMRHPRAFSTLRPPLASPPLPNPSSPSSSSLSKITPAAAEVPRGIAGSCSSQSIPAGCSPGPRDASWAQGETNLHRGPL